MLLFERADDTGNGTPVHRLASVLDAFAPAIKRVAPAAFAANVAFPLVQLRAVVELGVFLHEYYQAVALGSRPVALADEPRVVAPNVPRNLLHVLFGVDGDIGAFEHVIAER